MNFIFPQPDVQMGDDDPIPDFHSIIFQGGRAQNHQPAKKLPQFITIFRPFLSPKVVVGATKVAAKVEPWEQWEDSQRWRTRLTW